MSFTRFSSEYAKLLLYFGDPFTTVIEATENALFKADTKKEVMYVKMDSNKNGGLQNVVIYKNYYQMFVCFYC